jgi:hypothetical protein
MFCWSDHLTGKKKDDGKGPKQAKGLVLSNAMRAVRAYLSSGSSAAPKVQEDAKEESKEEPPVSASAACVILADADARQQQVWLHFQTHFFFCFWFSLTLFFALYSFLIIIIFHSSCLCCLYSWPSSLRC